MKVFAWKKRGNKFTKVLKFIWKLFELGIKFGATSLLKFWNLFENYLNWELNLKIGILKNYLKMEV